MANEILYIENFPQSNIAEITELKEVALAGQNQATVANADGYNVDDYTVLGNLAAEGSQILQIQSIVGLLITFTANISVEHGKGDPLTKIKSNQAKVYHTANVDGTPPGAASFSTLAGTVNLQADQVYTEFVDNVGGSDYWFLQTFYNSDSATETDKADAVPMRGGAAGEYANWVEVRDEAGLKDNKWIEPSVYQEKLEMAQSEVTTSLRVGGYTLPLTVIPKVVKNAVLLIAAGYVLLRDYGATSSGTLKEGKDKLKQGRDLLLQLEKGSELTDPVTGDPIATDQNDRINGYPDDSSAFNNPSEERIFRTTDKF